MSFKQLLHELVMTDLIQKYCIWRRSGGFFFGGVGYRYDDQDIDRRWTTSLLLLLLQVYYYFFKWGRAWAILGGKKRERKWFGKKKKKKRFFLGTRKKMFGKDRKYSRIK